jgi:uncharacterized protein YbjQ (UPF0145 family)
MENLINLLIIVFLICLGYIAGSIKEKKHYKSIKERESKFKNLPAVTIKNVPIEDTNVKVKLVAGNVVISIDYFKRLLAILKNLFGGEITSYESLIDRARREAILRMKEDAGMGAKIIMNMRIETSSIGKSANNKNTVGSIEALAYGTAVIPIK